MPEGPECYRLTEKMNNILCLKKLVKIEVVGGRYKKHGAPFSLQYLNDTLLEKLVRFVSVKAKGKLIYMTLDNDIHLISTLGLMGKWVKTATKHQCIKMTYCSLDPETLSTGKEIHMYFVDQIHYGTFGILLNSFELNKKLATIGPSVIEPSELTWEIFHSICRKHGKKALPEFLMNQKFISGIGNYLKSEIMYQAQCSVISPLQEYSDKQLRVLYDTCIDIAQACTFGKYRLRVYRKRKDPNGNPVFTIKTPDKRTTHWVPNVMPIDIKSELPATSTLSVSVPDVVKNSDQLLSSDCVADNFHADDLYSVNSFDD